VRSVIFAGERKRRLRESYGAGLTRLLAPWMDPKALGKHISRARFAIGTKRSPFYYSLLPRASCLLYWINTLRRCDPASRNGIMIRRIRFSVISELADAIYSLL
jgi:hypothetical protein